MKRCRWPIGVLSLLLVAPALPAQFVSGPFGPAPIIVVPAPGASVSYVRVKKNSALSLSLYRGGYGFYGPAYSPFAPSVITRVIVQQPQIVLVPDPGLHPLAGVLGARRVLPPDEEPPPPPMPPPMPPPEDNPLPGKDAGIFKPLDPDNRDRARRPVPGPPAPAPGEKQPKPPLPAPPVRPAKPLDLDPRQESTRRIDLGKEAFERGEYGRAAERFRQAADLAPNSAVPLFLLGQAHVALGNYRRAFDAIQTGLRLDPDWPRQPFRPIELYGENVADYAEHMQALEDLLAAAPNDPMMLFLAGYQLWFDGRRDEAKLLLQRAAPSLPDPTLVDQFLQALPPTDIL